MTSSLLVIRVFWLISPVFDLRLNTARTIHPITRKRNLPLVRILSHKYLATKITKRMKSGVHFSATALQGGLKGQECQVTLLVRVIKENTLSSPLLENQMHLSQSNHRSMIVLKILISDLGKANRMKQPLATCQNVLRRGCQSHGSA